MKNVIIPAFGHYAALLSIRNNGRLKKGSEYRFNIQQLVEQKVVGGSTFVVRIAGEKELPKPLIASSQI